MEGGGEVVVVVGGVGLVFGIPGGFLGEDGCAIDDGGDFVIAGTEVEADAAAIEVTACGDFHVAGGRCVFGGGDGDLEGAVVGELHHVGIEFARAVG